MASLEPSIPNAESAETLKAECDQLYLKLQQHLEQKSFNKDDVIKFYQGMAKLTQLWSRLVIQGLGNPQNCTTLRSLSDFAFHKENKEGYRGSQFGNANTEDILGRNFECWLGHDMNKLSIESSWREFITTMANIYPEIVDAQELFSKFTPFLPIMEKFITFLKSDNEVARFFSFPYEATVANVQYDAGDKPAVEEIDMRKIAEQAAGVLAFRFFDVQTNKEPKFNIDVGDDFNIKSNYGMIMSIIYNLFKNSIKAAKKSESTPELALIAKAIPELGLRAIYFVDNGCGFDPMEIIKQAHTMIETGLGKEIKAVSPTAYERIKRWKQNSFSINKLELGEIFELLFIERLSGFELKDIPSSGLGLPAVKYMIESMGGKISCAQNAEGGVVFGILLPEQCFEGSNTLNTSDTTRENIEATLGNAFPRVA